MKRSRPPSSTRELIIYMIILVIAIVIAFTVAPKNVHADDNSFYWSGNDLYSQCTSTSKVDQTICVAYMSGVIDGFVATSSHEICTPPGFTIGQGTDMVIGILKQIPAIRHQSATIIVYEYFKQVFPCKGKKPKIEPNRY